MLMGRRGVVFSDIAATSEVQWWQRQLHSISRIASVMYGAWKLLSPIPSWASRLAISPAVLQSLGAATPELELNIICCQGTQPARLTRKLQPGYGKSFQNQKYFHETFCL